MAYTTMGVIKLGLTEGNFSLRTTGAEVVTGTAINATTGNQWVISSTGTGIEDFSKMILVFQPVDDFAGAGSGHATTASMNVTIKAATQGAKIFPTLAHQGDKQVTIFGGTPTSDAGTTRSYACVGPFESARFMSTIGGVRGLAIHLQAAAGNAIYSMAAIALPGAFSTYGA